MKIKPISAKYSESWWKNEITQSEERRKRFTELAEESIRVYNAQRHAPMLNDAERRLNVWWYCVNTLLPAFYSSTPKAEVNLRKRTGGLKYSLGSVILERNLQYALDQYFNFDLVGFNAALQFLLTGQAVLWARYDAKFGKQMQEFAVIRDPMGQLIDGLGQPYMGGTEGAVEQGNLLMMQQEVEQKVDEKAVLELVQYTDYFCNDARTESEIEWQGRRAYLDRDDVKDKFGADVADSLSYNAHPQVMRDSIGKRDDRFEGKAELFEIWCEKTNKVYWLAKGEEKMIIESSEPPIKFDKFYPCSVIRQSVDPDSVIPISDYAHCKDLILEVERLTTRIHAVTQAIRTNGLYDPAIGAMVQELLTGDLKLSPAQNWPSYKGRGGLAQSIEWMPIEQYVNALQILQQARTAAQDKLYEVLKVSDLLRGTSDQYKSATANRLENQWSSLGLIVRQNMFTKFVSDAIANLGTIIAEQFDAERIMDIGDAEKLISESIYVPAEGMQAPPEQEMEAPQPGEMPEQNTDVQEMAAPKVPTYIEPMEGEIEVDEAKVKLMEDAIMEVYRDPKERCYRIEVASDSMVAIDQQQQQGEAKMLIEAAGGFFGQMKALIEEYPPLAQFSLSLFQNMIKRFKGGKEIDGLFSKALQQIVEIAKAKEEAAKQPPPPDPTTQEMQYRMQIAQIESQARLQAASMEMQDKSMKNQIEVQAQQLEMQRDQLGAQLQIQKQQFDEYVKQQELALRQQELQIKASANENELIKIQTLAQTEVAKANITQEKNRLDQMLELQAQDLERMRIQLAESEKLMEERRLRSEQELERIRIAMDNLQRQPIVLPAPAATAAPASKSKRGKLNLDDLGNFSIDMED